MAWSYLGLGRYNLTVMSMEPTVQSFMRLRRREGEKERERRDP